ncbi:hypothetical protein MTO96_013234 [Rhipicephalus appendiculatus]
MRLTYTFRDNPCFHPQGQRTYRAHIARAGRATHWVAISATPDCLATAGARFAVPEELSGARNRSAMPGKVIGPRRVHSTGGIRAGRGSRWLFVSWCSLLLLLPRQEEGRTWKGRPARRGLACGASAPKGGAASPLSAPGGHGCRRS